MNPIKLRQLSDSELTELSAVYDETKDVKMRTRTQAILLAAEQNMSAPEIAKIVRKDEQSVRRWLKRYNQEGINGLSDAPRSGGPKGVTTEYSERLLAVVRRRPRALNQPYSLWTLQRLVDFMAEETGLRFSTETVRLLLKANEIVISRPQHKISSPDPDYTVKKRRLKSNEIT
jgi:transposase